MVTLPLALIGDDRAFLPGNLAESRTALFTFEQFQLWLRGSGQFPAFISDPYIGTAPIHALFRMLEQNRETSFQLWLLAMFALNFWISSIAFFRWSREVLISGGAAFIFAFGIYSFGNTDQASHLARMFLPVGTIAAIRWSQERSNRHLIIALTVLVLQAYCSIGVAIALLQGYICLGIASAIIRVGKKDAPENTGPSLLWLLFTLVVSVPLIIILARSDVNFFVSQPAITAILQAHPAALSWQDLVNNEHVHNAAFPGIFPILVVLASILMLLLCKVSIEFRAATKLILIAMLLNLLLVFVMSSPSIAFTIHWTTMFICWPLLLLLAFAKHFHGQKKWLWAIGMISTIAIVLDNKVDVSRIERYDKWESRRRVDLAERHISRQYDGVSRSLNYQPIPWPMKPDQEADEILALNLDAMLAGQQFGVPVLNRPFGVFPKTEGTAQVIRDVDIDVRTVRPVRIEMAGGMIRLDGEDLVFADNGAIFSLIELYDGRIALRASNGKFVIAELFKEKELTASTDLLGDHGIFQIERSEDGTIGLMASDGSAIVLDTTRNMLRATSDQVRPTPLAFE
jgi:hypothetical protein